MKRRAKCERCLNQFCIGCTRPFYEITKEQEKKEQETGKPSKGIKRIYCIKCELLVNDRNGSITTHFDKKSTGVDSNSVPRYLMANEEENENNSDEEDEIRRVGQGMPDSNAVQEEDKHDSEE